MTRSADAHSGDLIVGRKGRGRHVSFLVARKDEERHPGVPGWWTAQVHNGDTVRAGVSDAVVNGGFFTVITVDDLYALVDHTAEQWIITAGTNVSSPVGPFPTWNAAADHYEANQPEDSRWLAEPTIIPLLRPAPVETP